LIENALDRWLLLFSLFPFWESRGALSSNVSFVGQILAVWGRDGKSGLRLGKAKVFALRFPVKGCILQLSSDLSLPTQSNRTVWLD
jgi:hypothetical protein